MSLLLAAGLLAGCSAQDGGGGTTPEISVTELIAQGWDDFGSGNWAEARDGFQRATDKESDNVEAWTGLGWSQARLDDLQEARAMTEELKKRVKVLTSGGK